MPPTIQTARLLLRPLEESHRREFLRVREISWPLHQPWFPTPDPSQTPDDLFTELLARQQVGLAERSEYRFVAHLPNGQAAALVTVSQIVRRAAWSCFTSWSVSADVHRQGYGTEAVGGLLDFAFAPEPTGLGLHRVQAAVIPSNARSIRVAEKNVMAREGLMRKYLRIAGQWQDHILFAKLADEHIPTAVIHPL